MAVVSMKNLLESGVHFGHQTQRWDPRMKKFIFAQRNGIHIIDLQKTIASIRVAYDVVRENVLAGKSVLFVGTKKQAQNSIKREAERCEMYYVNNRWLGGMLTNFSTIKKSLLRLKKIEKMEIDGTFERFTKKEIALTLKEKEKLEKNLGGIKEMSEPPGLLFIIDTYKEAIAVAEARRLGIPVIAVVDTNCNPIGIDYPIPGNDDAIRAINLFTQVIANAVIEADNEQGLKIIETLQDEGEEEAPSNTPPGKFTESKNANTAEESNSTVLGEKEFSGEEKKGILADREEVVLNAEMPNPAEEVVSSVEKESPKKSEVPAPASDTKSASASKKSDAPASKPVSASKKSDAPASKSASTSKKSDAPASKPVSTSKKSDAPASKSASTSKKSDAPASKPASASKKSDAPASKPVSTSKKSDAPASKPVSTSKKSDAPASKSASTSKKSDAPASKPASANKKSNAPASKPASANKKSNAPASKPASASKKPSKKSEDPTPDSKKSSTDKKNTEESVDSNKKGEG